MAAAMGAVASTALMLMHENGHTDKALQVCLDTLLAYRDKGEKIHIDMIARPPVPQTKQ
jgi:hypothetical protein